MWSDLQLTAVRHDRRIGSLNRSKLIISSFGIAVGNKACVPGEMPAGLNAHVTRHRLGSTG
jgi:hypothetical protein